MSQILTLEISEHTFSAIQQQAVALGIEPEHLAVTLIEQQFSQVFKLPVDASEAEAARLRFEHHFGTLRIEDAIAIDNESIDADLAREYASNHE